MLESFLTKYGYIAILLGTAFEGETIMIMGGFSAHRGYLKQGESVMKQALIGLFAVILIGGIARVAAASETTSETKAPKDSAIVSEDIFIVFADEPQHHFMRAFEHFLKHEWQAAAAEIRKGAGFLKLEAARAAADAKKELTAAVQMLEKLAGDVEKGAVRSAKDLQDVFAKAEHAVAKHHYLKAAEAWAKKWIKKAGHELRAAAVSLEHGFAWAGQKLEAIMIKSIDDARHIAEKLIEGVDWVAEEVGKTIEYLGKEIDKLGKAVAGS
jgi:hypothetical protein